MRVHLLFFASARDAVGESRLSLDVPPGASVEILKQILKQRYPAAAGLFSVCRFSMAEEYVAETAALSADSEIAVIPPVSGGASESAGKVIESSIVRDPIRMQDLADLVAGPICGAVLTFSGTVRADAAGDRRVVRIEYEGYEPMASKVLFQIAEEAAGRGVRVAVRHRLGVLAVGDVSICIAVGSAHRSVGFEAIRFLIESIKADLPIWKREEFSDGTSAWVSGQVPSKDLKK